MEQLADRRATGALHTETGTVYLQHGAVVHVDSPQSLDLGGLLTGCGRIDPGAWQRTVDRFAAERQVARMLIAQGALTRGELEVCHLAVLHDAAYFALGPCSRRTGFEPGVRHWLGPVNTVTPRLLRREAIRRHLLLQRIWPWPQVDSAPVVRTGRPPHAGLPPSPRQREILDHADGHRTPADLARLLGRSTYATTLEVRRLAAAGAIATPPTSILRAVDDLRRPDAAPPDAAPPKDRHPAAAPLAERPLPHRSRGATLCRTVPAAGPPPSVHTPEIALLLRLRTALEARL
ncbi:transcriptional regulator [Kitasatospora kifunensis]|uniref:Uncharacterized protein n=1 Tax=Kitasatospora kifunensis TaxID=58351 RepID=A0A7W7R8D6_KITKI|nr:transcriptional regulator [Kitasatospora kifunensis]MBB4927184.1 hypothetical protein [Kitasatospora kifunensis]